MRLQPFVSERYNLASWFTFSGRMGRLEFIGRILAITVIYELLRVSPLADIPRIFIAINGLMLWTQWSINARRLHDFGLSGWVQLLFYATLALGFYTPNIQGLASLGFVAAVSALIYVTMVLGLVFWVIVRPGTKGANRYGGGPDVQVFSDPVVADTPREMPTRWRAFTPG